MDGGGGGSRPVVGVPDEWKVVGAAGLVGEERDEGATLAFG